MPTTMTPTKDLLKLARETRYPLGAFLFIQRGLEYTVQRIHGEVHDPVLAMHPSRHVSGRQLCYGLRDLAVQEYGLMARAVLRSWNIHSCEDFGRVVFAMVNAGLMHKTDTDDADDFTNVYRFSEAFAPDRVLIEV